MYAGIRQLLFLPYFPPLNFPSLEKEVFNLTCGTLMWLCEFQCIVSPLQIIGIVMACFVALYPREKSYEVV